VANPEKEVSSIENVYRAAMYLSARAELRIRIRHWKKHAQNSNFSVKRRITFQSVLSATFSVV